MAIRLIEEYPNRVGAPTADYPHGVPRNKSTPTATDGTPFEQSWFRDQEGFFQGLMETAGITPNGQPDTVLNSDYLDALNRVTNGVIEVDMGGAADVTLSAYQGRVAALKLTGALAANVDLIVPDTERMYWIIDETTGDFSVTVKTAAGTGVKLFGESSAVRSDGTNVVPFVNGMDRRVIYVDTITDLQALPVSELVDGQQVQVKEYHAGTGVGGGEFYWDAGSTDADNGGTVFSVEGVTTGRWKRPISGCVNLDYFGVLGDGVTLENETIQDAVDAVPNGGVLIFPAREMTILVDVPEAAAGNPRPAAVTFDKPMTVLGNKKCLTKIKDFCTAYEQWGTYYTDNRNAAYAYKITSSDVRVDGLQVDANADNHYETDGSGTRWWETGPENKRPPSGIVIWCAETADNIVNVVVENCRIKRPLTALAALGSVTDNYASFLEDTESQGVCKNIVFRGNTSERCRGNDYIFNGGVADSVIRDNFSVNSYYHATRFYSGCLRCESRDNKARNDYKALADLYTQDGLGYWRTDDPAHLQYTIKRSGYAIGTGIHTSDPVDVGNVQDCHITNNQLKNYNLLAVSADTSSAILAMTSDTAPLRLTDTTYGCSITGNRIYNTNNYAITAVNLGLTSSQKCFIADNKVFNPRKCAVIQQDNVVFSGNEFVDFLEYNDTSSYACLSIQGEFIDVVGNGFKAADTLVATGIVVRAGQSSNYLFVDNNRLSKNIRGYSAGPDGIVLQGGQGFSTGEDISRALIGGWINASGTGYDIPLSLIVSSAGCFILGTIDSSASAGNEVCMDIDNVSTKIRGQIGVSGTAVVVVAGTETVVGQSFPLVMDGSGQIKILGATANIGILSLNMRLSGLVKYWE